MITTSNLNEARKQIQRSNEKPVIVEAHSIEFNRKILEYGGFQIFLGLDKPLNHIMAKIAAKNNISVGIGLPSLQKLAPKQKAQKLSQIIQNIKFCRKAKTKISLLNVKDKKDAFAFLSSLGASTKQAEEAMGDFEKPPRPSNRQFWKTNINQ